MWKMELTRLGRTELMASRSGFGAIPIQRLTHEESARLLLKAYDNGINFFDTARAYSNSEEKIGLALGSVRKNIIIATKTMSENKKDVLKNLETSLRLLRTDYIDIYQLHNPGKLPDPDDSNSSYTALLEAKKKGMIRYIGITAHHRQNAIEAAQSGLFDTVQFPLNYLSSPEELEIIDICRKKDIGLIIMKALSGGLITNAAVAFTFLRQYEGIVPIWGVQRESELDQFISLEQNPPKMNQAFHEIIAKDKRDLSGNFCRACGYCQPCPMEIPIPMAARMSLLLRRMPYQQFLTDEWQEKMLRIEKCTECGQCRTKCPYHLDTPTLLKKMLKDYKQFLIDHTNTD